MIHIPDETYAELNELIERAASDTDEGSREVEIEAEAGDVCVALKVELSSKTSTCRFTDDAWGYRKTFTETNWECSVEVLEVNVTDEDGNPVESDFDEEYIEQEYSSTSWQ